METLKGILAVIGMFAIAIGIGGIKFSAIRREQNEFDAYADTHRNLPIPQANRL